MNNQKMLNILSAIDETETKDIIIQELCNPMYEIGFKPTVLKIISQMLDQGLLQESNTHFTITEKGKEFFEISD